MSPSTRALPKWLELMLVAAPGLLIVLVSWSTATSSGARFFLGVLLGLSIAVVIAGLLALIEERGGWSRGRKRARQP